MSASIPTASPDSDSFYHGQAGQDIETLLFDGLIPPNDLDAEKRLNELYVRVEKWAKDAIAWYLKRKNRRKRFSLITRSITAVCTIMGGLIPLLVPILTNPSFRITAFFHDMDFFVIGQFGYIFLALAAAAMTIDRLFDFSSGWMRSMSTSITLQALLTQLQMDCQIIWLKKSQASDDDLHREMLLRLNAFCLRFIREISEETENWQKKLKQNLELTEAELDKTRKETQGKAGQRPNK